MANQPLRASEVLAFMRRDRREVDALKQGYWAGRYAAGGGSETLAQLEVALDQSDLSPLLEALLRQGA